MALLKQLLLLLLAWSLLHVPVQLQKKALYLHHRSTSPFLPPVPKAATAPQRGLLRCRCPGAVWMAV